MANERLTIPLVFEEENRAGLTFSDTTKIRLNPETNRIELKVQSWDPVTHKPVYDVPGSHVPPIDIPWVRTRTVEPLAMKAWSGFWCEPAANLPAGTAVKFRLYDGTTTRYWNGANWVAVTDKQWNTHEEVSAHIASFPVTSGKLAVVVGLETTDANQTPWAEYVDILITCEELSPFRSLIADSFIPELRTDVKPPVDFAIKATGTTLISLLDLETPFNIASVDGVYDHVADPRHRVNLLSAYDPVSKTITLTTAVERGKDLWVVFLAELEVVVNWGSQDYVEVEKLPALVIDSINPVAYGNVARAETKDMTSKTAVVRRLPLRLTCGFEVVLLAEKTRTLLAMMGQILRFIAGHPVLRWRDIDQNVSLKGRAPAGRIRPALSDKHEAVADFAIENAYVWTTPEQVLPLVQRFNLSLVPSPDEG